MQNYYLDFIVSTVIFCTPRKYFKKGFLYLNKYFKSSSKKQPAEVQDVEEHYPADSPEAKLNATFKSACKAVENSTFLSIPQSTLLYGLYKQAHLGNCHLDEPKKKDSLEKAWTERQGLTKEEAKRQYIQNVQNFMPNIKLTDEEPENVSDSDDDLFLKEDEVKKRSTFGAGYSRFVMGEGDDNKNEVVDEAEDVTEFFQLIADKQTKSLESSLVKGFNVNKRNATGMNPLHYAIENGNVEAFNLLVECYNDINVADSNGMTPLHYAVVAENEEIIKELMKRGADVNIRDNDGSTPLEIASSSIKKLLV